MLNLFGDTAAGPADSLRVITLLDHGVAEARNLDREPAVQAALYYTLGGLYRKLGKLDQSDKLLTLALDRRRAIFGPQHREVAESLVALAGLRVDQSRLADAEKLAREGVAMSRGTLPPNDPAMARAETELGRVLEHRGAYPQAAAALEEAARMLSRQPENEADLASNLSELANTKFYAGDYAASEALNRRVLNMHQRLYGGRHPLIADDYLNLASIQTNLGHFAAAEDFDRKALEINRAYYGDDHPETGASLNYLGQALVLEGRYDEAEDMLRQSLLIQERAYGPKHVRVAVALNELGLLAMKRGRPADAEPYFARAADIDRAVYGDRHQAVALETANLATAYMQQDRYAEAERLFRQVIACYKEILPPNHLNIAIAELKLGRTLLKEGRYADAEPHMLTGYRIASGQPSPPAYWLQASRQDLVNLYEKSGHPEKAAPYRAASATAAAKP